MGHKVNPYGFRLGVIYPWKSKWYSGKREYAGALHEDIAIRDYIRKHLTRAGISSIDIERKGDDERTYGTESTRELHGIIRLDDNPALGIPCGVQQIDPGRFSVEGSG